MLLGICSIYSRQKHCNNKNCNFILSIQEIIWEKERIMNRQRREENKYVLGEPEEERKVGRPKLRRLKDAGDDLREMKVKRWRQKAHNICMS
jgi:3-methyladenine DNA glycosylase AlkD